MSCKHEGCDNLREVDRDECFKHRVSTVGLSLKAPAVQGNFHQTVDDFKREHFGTTSDTELAARGIERA